MTVTNQRPWWRLTLFVFVMLLVEFLDEFSYSALEAARPLIRDSFDLSYVQISLITTIPLLVAIFVEPVVGLFADAGRRRYLVVTGGILFGAGMVIEGLSSTFLVFMIGAVIQAPASGVFITLAQASLMDDAPKRRENRMALWTFSGSLAVVTGPLTLSAMIALGSDWRPFFIGVGLISILVALWMLRLPHFRSTDGAPESSLRANASEVMKLLRRWVVWRWLILLEFSDLLLDVMFSLLALYMVDVVGVSQAQAGLAIAVWTGVGLIGDFAIIAILERVRGLVYLRISAAIALILFPLFLLIDTFAAKLVLLALMGLFNAGWYAILQAKLYDALGEQSGAVLVVGNAAGMFGVGIGLLLGVVAQWYGLDTAMWLLLAGPIVLLIGIPRYSSSDGGNSKPEG